MIAGGGLDSARDVQGITVNRWPHGYAYEYNPVFEPLDRPDSELPCVIGRQPLGRIHSRREFLGLTGIGVAGLASGGLLGTTVLLKRKALTQILATPMLGCYESSMDVNEAHSNLGKADEKRKRPRLCESWGAWLISPPPKAARQLRYALILRVGMAPMGHWGNV